MLNEDTILESMKHMDFRSVIELCKANRQYRDICHRNKNYISKNILRNAGIKTEFVEDHDYSGFLKALYKIDKNLKLFLMEAIIQGNLTVIKYLIKIDLDLHAENDFVRNNIKNINDVLANIVLYGHLEIVKYLVEHGADIHYDHEYALFLAAENGHLDIVKYLVEHGADIHSEDDEALLLAVQHGHLYIVKYLVEYGADIHAQNDEALITSVAYSDMPIRNDRLEIIKYLVEHGANVQAQNNRAIQMTFDHEIKYLKTHGSSDNSDSDD